MQWGPRIVWGRGCPSTLSGAHVVEFNETGTAATCCQCAIVLNNTDRRDAFMALLVEAQWDLMAEAARQLAREGAYMDLWEGGE